MLYFLQYQTSPHPPPRRRSVSIKRRVVFSSESLAAVVWILIPTASTISCTVQVTRTLPYVGKDLFAEIGLTGMN